MGTTSEGRKRLAEEAQRRERAESYTRLVERRRSVTQQALEGVYAGAGYDEADALLHLLDDLGASVVVGDA
jgi:hypothetical protein